MFDVDWRRIEGKLNIVKGWIHRRGFDMKEKKKVEE
jgi:hypothetical protein